uniref:Uncharacterized protein n=1 Tax=Arundo donax TaxID=35708 RepID=A0A0A9BPR4_ARUDO
MISDRSGARVCTRRRRRRRCRA